MTDPIAVTGRFISMGAEGTSPGAPVTLEFSSFDTMSGEEIEGSGLLADGAVIGIRLRAPSTDALYMLLESAYTYTTSESFVITETDGSTSSFTATVESWDTTIAGQVSLMLKVTSSVTRG